MNNSWHYWLITYPLEHAFWQLCIRRLLKTLWQTEIVHREQFLLYQSFSTLSNNYTLVYRDFPWLCQDVSKVIRCRVVIMWERLNVIHFISHKFKFLSSLSWRFETNCLTFSHIQQICSRWLWKHTWKKNEIPFKWKYNNWIELKILWQKKKLLLLSNFFFCCHVFKKLSATEALESIYM